MTTTTTTYQITECGDTCEFASLDEAQAAIRACGGDFAGVTLRATGDGRIMDVDDDVRVGWVLIDGQHVEPNLRTR